MTSNGARSSRRNKPKAWSNIEKVRAERLRHANGEPILSRMVRFFTLCLTLTAATPPGIPVVSAEAGAVEKQHHAAVQWLAEAIGETTEIEERIEGKRQASPWALVGGAPLDPKPARRASECPGAEIRCSAGLPADSSASARAPPEFRIL